MRSLFGRTSVGPSAHARLEARIHGADRCNAQHVDTTNSYRRKYSTTFTINAPSAGRPHGMPRSPIPDGQALFHTT